MEQSLRRSLGLLPLVALGAAGVVGTSWIYTNGEFFDLYGAGGEIFGLMVAAVLATGVALAYGELAALLPRAGGEVVYAFTAFNRRVAFVAGWLLVGAYVSSLAFYVTALGQLLGDEFAWTSRMELWTIADTAVTLPVLALGVGLALLVFALNWRGVELGAQVQLVLFVLMVLVGLAIAVVGFGTGSPSNFWPPYKPEADAVAQTVRFVLPGLTFLTGFGLVAILAEDADLGPRQIRRAVVLAVAASSTFYIVVLLASAWVQPWEQTAGTERGTIDAFAAAGFPVLSWGAFAISVGGLLTSFLALFVATSRVLVAMGRAGLMPAALGRLSGERRTPKAALVFTLVAALVLGSLGPGAITWFLDTGGVYIGLAWVIGVACLYQLPRRRPDLQPGRGLVIRVLPAVGALAALGVVGYALWPGTDLSLLWPQEYLILGAWVGLGVVMYAVAPRMSDHDALAALLGEHADPADSTGEGEGAGRPS